MATLYIRNFDDDLKEWLEQKAKDEGFNSLAEYLRVYFTRLKRLEEKPELSK